MANYYVITPNSVVEKYSTDKKHLELGDFYEAIQCEWVEMVSFKANRKSYTMLVDEEGKLNGRFYNPLATTLYGYHGSDYIVGRAVVVKSAGFAPFNDVQSAEFEEHLRNTFPEVEIKEVK